VAQPAAEDVAVFDLAMTVCLMRFVSDLHIGKVNPRHFDFGFNIEDKKYDLPELLRQNFVQALNVREAIDAVEPTFPTYRKTEAALRRYRALAGGPGPGPPPAWAAPLKPGMEFEGLPWLVRRLRLVGDLPEGTGGDSPAAIYGGPLVDAVKHFQSRHGLAETGVIDRFTWLQLETPFSARVRQMELTLERWRWVPQKFSRPPIVVNLPEFRLRAVDAAFRVELQMKVIAGRAYRHQTPVFASDMRYLIFHPYWNVPPGITRKELVPKITMDNSYLAKNGYEVMDEKGGVVNSPVDAQMLLRLRSGKWWIRQVPGPKNALGLVKFIFPNSHDVYLHGTPAQALFSRSRRDFSHGCIRVENPFELAEWVLQDRPEWTPERIQAAMDGDKPLQVSLKQPIPVLIVYGTAVVRENGDVCFFEDIYGHDAELDRVLAKGYPYPG
jgi:murein L,D-transpeptidase YcbB/YkuD